MGKPSFDPSQPFEPVAQASDAKPAFDPSKPFSPVSSDNKMSAGQAAVVQGQNGALLGLRPVVAGAGAGLGDLVSQWDNLKNGKGINLKQTKDAFLDARQEANQEQNQASQDHPYIAGAANLGGSVLTLPLLPAKGLSGAVKLGAGLGAAQAAGSANSVEEAAKDVGFGGAVGGGAFGAGKALGAGAKAIGQSDIGQAIGNKAKDIAKGILTKLPSELTGIPDKEIEAYSQRADKVKKIFEDSGGDASLAAKHAKENIQQDVQRTRAHLNDQISTALSNSPSDPIIDASPIISKLENAKNNLHPVYGKKDVSAIDGIISDIKQSSTNSNLSIQDLQKTKNFLYDSAKGTYTDGGLIFPIGKDAARAAKMAGREAKELIDKLGPPEIKNANRQLQQLHEIEDHMGNNLLNPNAKSHSDLYAVGGGAKNNNSEALTDLGAMTGQNYLQNSSDLAAARTFGKASLLPTIKTGRALVGPVAGGAIGGAIGGIVGSAPGAYLGSKIGAGIGTVLSSPSALKLAIDTGRISGQVASKVASALGLTPGNIGELYHAIQTPQGQELFIRAMEMDNNQAAASNKGPSKIIKPRSQLGI